MGKCLSVHNSIDPINNENTVKKVKGFIQSEDQRLMGVDVTQIPRVIFQEQLIRARVIDVYDGDTITVIFFISDKPVKFNIRLNGIDTPEIKSGKGRLKEEKIAGIKCRDFLSSFINGKIVDLMIHDWDKYGGRLLGDVFCGLNININNLMLNRGYAIPYDGGKKHKWTRKKLINIINK